jgi:25S rRNA (adenine2142-N1)-methyltransferase
MSRTTQAARRGKPPPIGRVLANIGKKSAAAVPKRGGLANGRPPTAAKHPTTLSHKQTQSNIREYHQLNKQVAAAEANGDQETADQLKQRIEDLGGLKSYQLASIQGQANDRGGDSSTVLMQWLKPVAADMASRENKLRMLEIGALSTNNACSKSGLFDITRIDLFSQAEGIVQQDFMERPVPTFDTEQFDIISLSLVLNFVPDADGRGEMLKRTCRFLDRKAPRSFSDYLQPFYPALFLVLPGPCISNSRYMNEERLTCMMASLGYVMLERKQTTKLVYYLWQLRDEPVLEEQDFPKKQVNPGAGRNNFSVVLR